MRQETFDLEIQAVALAPLAGANAAPRFTAPIGLASTWALARS
jgi:hypothetical protein